MERHLDNLSTQKVEHGGFALYCSAPAGTVATIPSEISYADASVLPLAFDTAAVGLYSPASEGFIGLPFPSANPPSSDKTIVVWGGSSSVGALVTQLAVASGAKVVATASEHNFDFCKKCGASVVSSIEFVCLFFPTKSLSGHQLQKSQHRGRRCRRRQNCWRHFRWRVRCDFVAGPIVQIYSANPREAWWRELSHSSPESKERRKQREMW